LQGIYRGRLAAESDVAYLTEMPRTVIPVCTPWGVQIGCLGLLFFCDFLRTIPVTQGD
jgi:hypothetical protein